jgi:hypothetical protein
VFDLMREDIGQLVFALHQIEHSLADEDVTSRQGECIEQLFVRKQMKTAR